MKRREAYEIMLDNLLKQTKKPPYKKKSELTDMALLSKINLLLKFNNCIELTMDEIEDILSE